MTTRLIDAIATTDPLSEIFSNLSVIEAMLDVEAALARAEARAGLIPASAAEVIAKAAAAGGFDAAALVRSTRQSGTPVIALVDLLTAKVAALDPAASGFVHRGATSQDIADTALVCLLTRAGAVLRDDHARLAASLRALSDRHATDVMLGRTLLQPAAPITFGLKVAGWFGGVSRSWARVDAALDAARVLQFGGAAGTLAGLGDRALAVAEDLASELGLLCPDAPWHAHGDRLAAAVAASGVYVGELAKMARDISLMMQAEIGEAAEPGGGSSAMPHKRNPSGCVRTLAAATRMPGLVASSLSGLVREHERAAGAWQAEWPIVADAMQTTGAALEAMRHVIADLTVDTARMRANLDATNGVIFAERVMLAAARSLGRDTAQTLVREVVARSRATGEPLAKILGRTPELVAVLTAEDLETIDAPDSYLGAADALRRRLLASAS